MKSMYAVLILQSVPRCFFLWYIIVLTIQYHKCRIINRHYEYIQKENRHAE